MFPLSLSWCLGLISAALCAFVPRLSNSLRSCQLSPRFRRLGFHPRTIVLGNVQCLQLIPSHNRLLSRGACLRSQEVTHEVDISPVGNFGEGLLGLTQLNVFLDQISIGELDALDELLFPPTIESVARARFSLQAWSKSLSLSFEKSFGLLVVRVDHHGKIEAQPSFDVFDS